MSKMAGYQIRNQYHTHYLTLTIVGWADVSSWTKLSLYLF